MKINQKKPQQLINHCWIWVATLLLVFVVGIVLGERSLLLQKIGNYWSDTVLRLNNSYFNAVSDSVTNLPTLVIDMPFENYSILLDQREQALEKQVFLAKEADFLTAHIRLGEQTIPIRLRLQQGFVRHLGEDDKWNFSVHTRDNQLLMGLSQFDLIDPADNNWLNEWAFMQALSREDILASHYQFVRVIFNGADRGIYALQARFEPEVLSEQGKPLGVIVGFDHSPLWESIALRQASVAVADPISNLTPDAPLFFEVTSFHDTSIVDDEIFAVQEEAAISLLRHLQSGEMAAKDVFDVKRYGNFLALADLWGATESISLVNLRYYYRPETGKLEPIGFNATATLDDPSARISLDTTYNDPAIQAAYATAAEQFSRTDYVTNLETELATAWLAKQQALSIEVELSPPWEKLTTRQALLRHSLNPQQSVITYLGPESLSMEAIIQIDIANILNLPIEVIRFDINGVVFLAAERTWLQGDPNLLTTEKIVLPGAGNKTINNLQFVRFHLPLTKIIEQNDEIDFNHTVTINVVTRILGQVQTQTTLVAAP